MSWQKKFADAINGCVWAWKTQSSFWIHLPAAAAVLALGVWSRLSNERMMILWLTIGCVMAAELFNTSIEQIVKVLHPRHDPQIGRALDAAAGAVLVLSIVAAVIGLMMVLTA